MQIQLHLPQNWLSAWPALANVWTQAGLIVILSIIIAYIFTFGIEKIIEHLARRTKTEADDMIISENRHRFSWLLITCGFQLAVLVTPLHSAFNKVLGSFSIIIGASILISVSSIIISEWGEKLARKTKTDIDEALIPLIRRALNVVYAIVAFLAILSIWKVNITPYLTGLGISGLVLGLALQDSLKNIFGGMSLIFDRNFNIGDKVKLESGEVGEILEIGLRSTKLRTYDNEIIFIPNGQLANQRIQNYRKPSPPVRIVVPFGVAYGSDVDKIKKIALGVIKKNVYYDPDGEYTDVIFTDMGESSINFQARFWVKNYKDSFNAKIETTESLYKTFVKEKINIPFPTRTVHVKK